jgi:hypothetical protein
MSGNWEKAYYPADGRAKGSRMAVTMGTVEEVYGAKLRDFTTVGIGGPAERMVFPRSLQEIQQILRSEREEGREVRFLGAGSNLLVFDGGVRGTVLCLKKNMGKMVFSAGGSVIAEGGTMLPRCGAVCPVRTLRRRGAGRDSGDGGRRDVDERRGVRPVHRGDRRVGGDRGRGGGSTGSSPATSGLPTAMRNSPCGE